MVQFVFPKPVYIYITFLMFTFLVSLQSNFSQLSILVIETVKRNGDYSML